MAPNELPKDCQVSSSPMSSSFAWLVVLRTGLESRKLSVGQMFLLVMPFSWRTPCASFPHGGNQRNAVLQETNELSGRPSHPMASSVLARRDVAQAQSGNGRHEVVIR